MRPIIKALLFALGSHAVRFGAEWLYWKNCTGILVSIFSGGSPACQGLRTVVDTLSTTMINYAAAVVTTAPRLLGATE